MIWDLIGMILVTVVIVLFFLASTILMWEKQDKKYKERNKK